MKLSIVIVNYNVKHFLGQCLNSVKRGIEHLDTEVFVVDNASSDGSCDMVREMFPWVTLIASPVNLGFSKGNNLAIEKASGQYVLLLNPDTVVAEDTFDKCIEFMDGNPDAGALGVRMIDGKGNFLPESKRGLPTPSVAFCKTFGLSKVFPKSKTFNRYHLGFLPEHETNEVEILSGAFMLMRKAALDKTGLLDETFFMYGEDIDLSYRLAEAGYQNHYFADTTVLHFKGKSSRKESFAYVKQFYGAMLLFVKKQYTSGAGKNFSLLMQSAIAIGGILSSFRRLFMLDAGTKNETKKRKPIWIVATAEEYTEISSLLEKSQTGSKERKRVSVDNIKGNAFCTLAELPSYLLANKGINIIFSIGTLTVSQILPELERLSDKSGRFHFHIQGTKGMAGTEMLSL